MLRAPVEAAPRPDPRAAKGWTRSNLTVETLEISPDGTIAGNIDGPDNIGSATGTGGTDFDLVRVRGNIAVVGFNHNTTDDGKPVTFIIDDDGTIDPTDLEVLVHETGHGIDHELVVLDEALGIIGVIYRGGSNQNNQRVTTVTVSATGLAITEVGPQDSPAGQEARCRLFGKSRIHAL